MSLLNHRRPQTVGRFKKWFGEQGHTHEIAATGLVKKCLQVVPETTLYTFILFGFVCFVATLDAKNDEGNIRWGCNYLDPNARIIGLSNWMCWKHRRMKVKDDIILNPGALWTLESAQFSACDNFSWETWERQAGRQAGRQAAESHLFRNTSSGFGSWSVSGSDFCCFGRPVSAGSGFGSWSVSGSGFCCFGRSVSAGSGFGSWSVSGCGFCCFGRSVSAGSGFGSWSVSHFCFGSGGSWSVSGSDFCPRSGSGFGSCAVSGFGSQLSCKWDKTFPGPVCHPSGHCSTHFLLLICFPGAGAFVLGNTSGVFWEISAAEWSNTSNWRLRLTPVNQACRTHWIVLGERFPHHGCFLSLHPWTRWYPTNVVDIWHWGVEQKAHACWMKLYIKLHWIYMVIPSRNGSPNTLGIWVSMQWWTQKNCAIYCFGHATCFSNVTRAAATSSHDK